MDEVEGPKVIKLDASLSIDKAAALKDELSAALSSVESLLLDLSAVEELDLSCLQVIYSARARAKEEGRELHFTGQASDRVVERLAACGFLRGPCERSGDLESALVGF